MKVVDSVTEAVRNERAWRLYRAQRPAYGAPDELCPICGLRFKGTPRHAMRVLMFEQTLGLPPQLVCGCDDEVIAQ